MDIGRMRQRIEVEQPSPQTRDASGGIVQNWSTFATCWAQVEPLTAAENLTAERIDADVTHRVRVRYKDVEGITPDMRLKMIHENDRILDINSLINLKELDETVEMMCRELQGASDG